MLNAAASLFVEGPWFAIADVIYWRLSFVAVALGLPAGSGAGSAASVGGLRLQGNGAVAGWMTARDVADVGDIGIAAVIAGNQLRIGGPYPTRPVFSFVDSTNGVRISINGGDYYQFNSFDFVIGQPLVHFGTVVPLPLITQQADATPGVAADAMGHIAQSATGGGVSVGGTWYGQGGTGATNGLAELRSAAGAAGVAADDNGSLQPRSVRKTGIVYIDDGDSPYAVPEGISQVRVDSTANPVTVTLPAAATQDGREIVVKDWEGTAAANAITVNPQALEELDNGGAGVGLVININNDSLKASASAVKWGTI